MSEKLSPAVTLTREQKEQRRLAAAQELLETDKNQTQIANEDTRQFSEKYSDDDFIEVISVLGGTAGTGDVADEVGCPHRTAYYRLDELRERGSVNGQKIGGSLVWTLAGNEA